jgi:cytochrome c peroxidase
VNAFSSKFDHWLKGEAQLTPQDERGLALFEGKGQCVGCHTTAEPAPGVPPLFTTFGFANIGTPRNPENPFYTMDKVVLDDGTPINPLGLKWVDLGLGGFLRTRSEFESFAAVNDGRHKFPTVRNVDKRPNSSFPKAYAHNGYFKSLKSIVHFYNTRDEKPRCPDDFTSEKEALRQGCWPAPEVEINLLAAGTAVPNIGNLGLTDEEEDAIVAFMRTLSDGYDGR